MSGSSVIHCVIISIFSGIYLRLQHWDCGWQHYKPAILGFFNSTFWIKETESCVQIENKPGAMSTSASPSSMAALEGLFVSDILVGMLAGAYLGPWIAKGQGRRIAMICVSLVATIYPILMAIVDNLCVASPFAMHFGDWMWSCCHYMPIVCH